MRAPSGIKPQDILVLLKLLVWKEPAWRHADVARELGLSQSEVSMALERCRAVLLMDSAKKRINKSGLLEFLLHGLKYVWPAQLGPVCRGIPTSHSTPPISKTIVSNADDQYVWPHVGGTVRGQSVPPLYASAPNAALKDRELHELLALIDALRVGRARERAIAIDELTTRLAQQ